MAQTQADFDKRLNEINSFMQNCITDKTTNENKIKQHKYVSPIQHHKSSLTLHSIVINKNITDFQHLFPNLEDDNIYLKKVIIFRIETKKHKNKYAHVLDISPFDLLSHFDTLHEIFNKFNVSKYNYLISKSLDGDEEYQQYLYSYNYIQDLIKNENSSDPSVGFICTVPSNLYLYINYKYNMILLPKYYEYNPSNHLYCDLDIKIFNQYCRTHTPLFDLQTLKIYLSPNIVKKYFKSILDALYKIFAFMHAKKTQINLKKTPSRIWDNFLFNLHPTMIYINNNINWSTFIQLYIQIFEINSINTKYMEPINQYFTETQLNDNKMQLNIKICPSGYKGGGGDGITDTIQYLAPEYLPTFDPKPIFEHKSKRKININFEAPKIEKIMSLSLHSNPMSSTELTQIKNNNKAVKFSNHKTEPSPPFIHDFSINDHDDESHESHETISNAFFNIDPIKQSVTVFSQDMYDDDGGATITDNDSKHNVDDDVFVVDVDVHDVDDDDDGYAAGGETPVFSEVVSLPINTKTLVKKPETKIEKHKKRTDIDYLPDLWNLSGNIFAVGVMLFILLNGYPPFEKANITDRWYKEIVKKKFHRFWKLHRASPINAIPIPAPPISFTPSTMNVLAPRVRIQKVKLGINKAAAVLNPFAIAQVQQSVSANNVFTHSPFSPTSPNTTLTFGRGVFSDDESIQRKEIHPHLKQQQSEYKMNVESAVNGVNHKLKSKSYQKAKKKSKPEYDYRSIQGLMNDLLRYNSWNRLQAFFNYNDNLNLQALYHKYWFFDIGYNDNEEYVEHRYNFNHEHKSEMDVEMDKKEILFLNILDKLRCERQEETRKKGKRMSEDEYISKCICWVMDAQENEPLFYPCQHIEIEGLSLCGSGELYTTKKWTNVFHEMFHIIQNNCQGQVDKKYTQKHKRLICRIKLAANNNEENKQDDNEVEEEIHRSVIFEVLIWKSVKWKDLNTKDDIVYVVQWRRLHGNSLDYTRVINHVINHCAHLFYLPKSVRTAMKLNKL